MRKISKIILIFLSVIFSALNCAYDANSPYIISEQKDLQEIERNDHQFCISLGLDFNDHNGLQNEIYWRCRLSLARHKIRQDATPDDMRNNIMIKNLIANIEANFVTSYEKWNDERNGIFNNEDHEICTALGYNFDSLDRAQIEGYLSCRKRLIADQQTNSPYHKEQYQKYNSKTYNLGFVINKKIDQDTEEYNKAKEQYPSCIKFDYRTPKFKDCATDYDSNKKCITNIAHQKFLSGLKEKAKCQKTAYIRFPDELLKDDDELQRVIKQKKANADINNKNDFNSLGISEDVLAQFVAQDSNNNSPTDSTLHLSKDAKNDNKKSSEKKFNSKDGLYTKLELTRLRQRFIVECQEEISPKVEEVFVSLQEKCHAIIADWENEK